MKKKQNIYLPKKNFYSQKNFLQIFQKILKIENFKGYYKGNSLNFLNLFFENFYGIFLKQTFFIACVEENQKFEIYGYFDMLCYSSLFKKRITYPIERFRNLIFKEIKKKKKNFFGKK